jgi:16S rRNA (uracil1498-N3)-methyltransferase
VKDSVISHQICRVLKLRPGENISLCDGSGQEVLVELEEISAKYISARVISRNVENLTATKKITLFCSLLKNENFELVVQKATEVGATRIVPIISERTVKLGTKIERLKIIAKEACEQCGRAWLPEIADPLGFVEALKIAAGRKLFLNMGGSQLIKESKNKEAGEISIFVGPEGGWTTREEEIAKNANCEIISLGSTILRAETAAIVAVYVCANIY